MGSRKTCIAGLFAIAVAVVSGCNFHDDEQVAWYTTPSVFSIYSVATAELRYHLNEGGEAHVRSLLINGDYTSSLTEDFLTGQATSTDQFFFYTHLAESGPGDCLAISALSGWQVQPSTSAYCEVGETTWPE